MHHGSLTRATSSSSSLVQVPTFEEVVDMVREAEINTGRRVGIYAELKGKYIQTTHTSLLSSSRIHI